MNNEIENQQRETHVSYSQFTTYVNCPKSWELKYKNKLSTFTSNIHNVFGTAMHVTIQTYLDEIYNSNLTSSEIDDKDWKKVLKENIKKEYSDKRNDNNGKDFVTLEDLMDAYVDGTKIIEDFISIRQKFFKRNKVKLIGTEIELNNKLKNNVSFKGFIDIVIFDETDDKYYIIDLKTSLNGWSDKVKKDDIKRLQLLLYKKFFSLKFDIPLDKIDCYFLILKRKVTDSEIYTTYRIQQVKVPNSERTINNEYKLFDQFLDECFNENGTPIDKHYPIAQYATSCKYCPFYYKNADEKHLGICPKWEVKSKLLLENKGE